MTNLQETLAEIKKVTQQANLEVTEEPRETYRGRMGKKNRAKEELKDLKEEYRSGLLASAVFIVVTGEGAKDFRELSNSAGCFRADPETFYKAIIEDIPTSLYGREGVASLFDMVTRRLEDHTMSIGILEYPQMLFKQEYSKEVKTKEDFLAVIKKAVNSQIGSWVVGVQTINDLVDAAIEKNHKNKDTPVVLATSDSNLAVELDTGLNRLTPRVFLVNTGTTAIERADFDVPEVTQESVNKVMKTIKASLKR